MVSEVVGYLCPAAAIKQQTQNDQSSQTEQPPKAAALCFAHDRDFIRRIENASKMLKVG